MKVRLLPILVMLFFSLAVSGQKHYTRNLSLDNGLPSNKIRDIYKDSRGDIWIGTSAGLTRYNGNQFKTYTTEDGLPGNRIWSITEDPQGNLWLACYGGGISRFDGTSFTNYSEKDGLINNNVRKIEYSDTHHGLMIGTVYGFSFYRKGEFSSFIDTTLEHKWLQVTEFLETDSLIYLLTYRDNKRYIAFNPQEDTYQYLPSKHRFHHGYPFTTCSFITSAGDTLIGNYMKGMKIYRDDTLLVNDKVGQVFDIAEDERGNLWFASWNNGVLEDKDDPGGIYQFNSDTCVHYNDKLGITTQLAWCLYYDKKENLLWIGTLDQGIYLLPLHGISYEHAEKYNPQEPRFNDLYFDSDGNQWMSVGDSLFRFGEQGAKGYPKQKLLRRYMEHNSFLHDPNGSWKKYQRLIQSGNYSFGNPYRIKDSIIPPGSIDQPNNDFDQQRISSFGSFSEDRKGHVWINSTAGYYYLAEDDTFQPACWGRGKANYFFNEKNDLCELEFNFLRVRWNPVSEGIGYGHQKNMISYRENTSWSNHPGYEKEGEKYWIVNNTDGIFSYSHGKLRDFKYLSDTLALSYQSVAIDSTGRKVVGTSTGKIYILKEKRDSLFPETIIGEKNGLLGTIIRWLAVDSRNQLWAGTNKGLNIIPLNRLYKDQKLIVQNFTGDDGYFDHTSHKAVFNPPMDTLFVLSSEYLTKIPVSFPSNYRYNGTPDLSISDVKINYKDYDWSSSGQVNNWSHLPTENPKLEHHQDNLIFHFGLKYFRNPENVRYSYKLSGLQDEWTSYSPEGKAVFTSLPPGRYHLKIKAYILSHPDKLINERFSFRILPPWWQTVWFYSVLGMLILLTGYFAMNYRIKKLKKRAQTQNRMNQLKLEALQAQMNPHFIFNGFNSIQMFVLEKSVEPALQYINDFSGLIRRTMENSSRQKITLDEEIDYLKNYIELERTRMENLEYKIHTDEKIDPQNIHIPPMLVQPFIENSIHHGIRHLTERSGKIWIRFEIHGEHQIKCTVRDNGIGRKRASQLNENRTKTYKSRGSSITEERLDLISQHNGFHLNYTDLYDGDECKGTLAELIIPLK